VGDYITGDELTGNFDSELENTSIGKRPLFRLLAEIRRKAFWDFCNTIRAKADLAATRINV